MGYQRARYFADRANWFEILQGLLLLAVCACILAIMGFQANLGIDTYTTAYVDFGTLLNISRHLQFLFGMVFIFQTLRGIKILRLLPAVGPSIQAIGQTLADPTVLRFLVFLGWMVLGFGLGMHAIFGSQSLQWSTWYQSVVGVYRFVWGEWDVEEMVSVDGQWSFLLFIILTFFITGTMANVFIAIVGEQYGVHLIKSDQDWIDEVNAIMSTWYGRSFVQRHPADDKNVASRILKTMVLADDRPKQQNDQGRTTKATRRTTASEPSAAEITSAAETKAAHRALLLELEVAKAEIEEHKQVRSLIERQDEQLQRHDEKLEQVLRAVTANQQGQTADAQPSIRI